MLAMKVAAGIVGAINVEKLVIVWTQAESEDDQAKAMKCFEAIVMTTKKLYEHAPSEAKKAEMKPLYNLVLQNRLQTCTVSKGRVGELQPLVNQFHRAPPATVTPDHWATNPAAVEEHISGFEKFLETIGKIIAAVVRPMLAANGLGFLLP